MSKRNILIGYDAEQAERAMLADIEECGCTGKEGPRHTSDYTRNGTYYVHQCDSRSRFYNSVTGRVEGRSHCSCDYCF